jgi:hypothetical protein
VRFTKSQKTVNENESMLVTVEINGSGAVSARFYGGGKDQFIRSNVNGLYKPIHKHAPHTHCFRSDQSRRAALVLTAAPRSGCVGPALAV